MARAARPNDIGPMDVFLVEDSPLVLERVRSLLAGLPGVRITGHAAAADGAIEAILAGRPDVVLLDLKLAQGSGFDVLRAVHERAPQVSVYMLSNFASTPYRKMAEQLGARGFFDKTRDFDRIREVVSPGGLPR